MLSQTVNVAGNPNQSLIYTVPIHVYDDIRRISNRRSYTFTMAELDELVDHRRIYVTPIRIKDDGRLHQLQVGNIGRVVSGVQKVVFLRQYNEAKKYEMSPNSNVYDSQAKVDDAYEKVVYLLTEIPMLMDLSYEQLSPEHRQMLKDYTVDRTGYTRKSGGRRKCRRKSRRR